MKYVPTAWLAGFLLVMSSIPSVFGQGAAANTYVVAHRGMQDGLPQSSVNDLLHTDDGFLWLATFGGLVRYDGATFTTFDRSNTPCMRSDRVLLLYGASNGTLWISTEDGFLEFAPDGACTLHKLEVDGQVYAPMRMVEDGQGRLWLSLDGQPYRQSGDGFARVEVSHQAADIRAALADSNGVWIAHEKELLRTTGDRVVRILDLGNQISEYIVDMREHPKGSGTYFFATSGDGVIRYKNGSYTRFAAADGLASRYTWKFENDRSGTLWVVSYDGLSWWNGTGFTRFSPVESNADLQITSLTEDEEGHLWLGTTNQGFYQIRPTVVSAITREQGITRDQMLSLTRLRDGTGLFSTNCGGLYEWRNGRAMPSAFNRYLANLCVWSVFQDSQDRIWVGSRILYRTDRLDQPGYRFGEAEGFPETDIFAITEDRKGRIWVGTFVGVFRYENGRFRRFSTENGLSYNDTRAFHEDRAGRMWVGSSAGLNVIEDDRVRQIDLNPNDPQPYVRAFFEEADGTLWVGTYGNGIFRIREGQVVNIRRSQGLFDDIVSHLVPDQAGYLWMGSNKGIARVSLAELQAVADGRSKELRAQSYGTSDGMPVVETNGGFQPNAYLDTDGRLYMPTVLGVAVVDTRRAGDLPEPPPVRITRLVQGETDLPLTAGISMPHNQAFLEIHYAALAFRDAEQVRFRYMLEGIDTDWHEAGDRRSALFTLLPPGTYTFLVSAKANGSAWNPEPARFTITVVPPFWQTIGFRLMVFVLIVAAGGTTYQLRVRALTRANERQRKFTEQVIASQEQERRRIASDLHDGLGQQIMVIKNRAEAAKNALADPEATGQQLDAIMVGALDSLRDVRSISHNLRPMHLEKFGLTEALESLCDDLLRTTAIEWSHHIDPLDGAFSPHDEIHFYRVVQEATRNILKHAGAASASVLIRRTEDRVEATIWDDGIGFDAQRTDAASTGLGFAGMRERVGYLGGSLDIRSTPGEGTTLRITLQL